MNGICIKHINISLYIDYIIRSTIIIIKYQILKTCISVEWRSGGRAGKFCGAFPLLHMDVMMSSYVFGTTRR